MPVWMRGRRRFGERFAAGVDIFGHHARESADYGPVYFLGDLADRLEIFRRGVGITGLNDVDIQARELSR